MNKTRETCARCEQLDYEDKPDTSCRKCGHGVCKRHSIEANARWYGMTISSGLLCDVCAAKEPDREKGALLNMLDHLQVNIKRKG